MIEAVIALRLLKRALSSRYLLLYVGALTLAVSLILALALVSARVLESINQSSHEFIAADRMLVSADPASLAWLQEARKRGLTVVPTLSFSSMLFSDQGMQLAAVKAVSDGYPLRGQLQLSDGSRVTPGAIWLEPRLGQQLQVQPGDWIGVGETELRLGGWIMHEPDAGFQVFRAAPRALIHYRDLAATEVIQPGSRLRYRYLFAGPEEQLNAYGEWLGPQLQAGQRYQGVREGQSPVSRSLVRSDKFFRLAGLVGVLLCSLAILLVGRHYFQSQLALVAIFKTLGASRRQVHWVFLLQFAVITALGCGLGLVLGWGWHWLLIRLLAGILPSSLPAAGAQPWLVALACGALLSSGMALRPLNQLLRASPLHIFNRQLTRDAGWVAELVLPLAAIFALSWGITADGMLSLGLVAGILLLGGLLGLFGSLLIFSGQRIGSQAGQSIKLALNRLKRMRWQGLLQLASLSLALLLLAVLWLTRQELVSNWQQQLPDDAPNFFLLNISPGQQPELQQLLDQRQVPYSPFYPVIRGRLVSVNGEPVAQQSEDDERRPGIDRELNLTWSVVLPSHNRLVAGQWRNREAGQVSVESGVAERLGLNLGDRLAFRIGGRMVDAQISSLREVDWESIKPNFFMIFSPDVLAETAVTYLVSLRLEGQHRGWINELAQRFPTVSIIDVEALITQVAAVIEQVSRAVLLLLVLVLVAACLVVTAQVQISLVERRQELTLMRTLGASRQLLQHSVLFEFAVVGLLAGMLGAAVAELCSWILLEQWLEMRWQWHPLLLWMPLLGAVVVALLGVMLVRPLFRQVISDQLRRIVG